MVSGLCYNISMLNISASSIFKVIFILILFWALFVLRDLVLVVLTAILIASAVEPATRWFKKYKVPRVMAVLIVYLLAGLIFAVSFYFLLIPLLSETTTLLKDLPAHLTELEVWNPLQDGFFGQSVIRDFSLREAINQANLALSGSFNFLGAASIFFGGMLSFVLIIVLSFYLSVQEGGVSRFLRLVTPIKYEEYVLDLWRRSEVKIGLWVQGQIVLAVIVGVLTYLGLLLLGIPNALLLAFLAALMEIIPVFGPIIAAVPAIALGFLDGGLTVALIVVGLYVIIQQFESQLIYPLVVKKVVGLSPIVVILSLVVGFKLAGFLGILISVPLAAVVMVFLEDMDKRKHATVSKSSGSPNSSK